MARLARLMVAGVLLIVALAPPALAQAPRRGGVFRVPVPEAPTSTPIRSPASSPRSTPAWSTASSCASRPGPRHRGRPITGSCPTSPRSGSTRPRRRWSSLCARASGSIASRRWTAARSPPTTSSTRSSGFGRSRPCGRGSRPVQSIDVVDRYTVRLVLREPFAPLLNHLANPAHCAILPARDRGEVQGSEPARGGDRHRAVRAEVLPARGPRRVRAQPGLLDARPAVPRRRASSRSCPSRTRGCRCCGPESSSWRTGGAGSRPRRGRR